MYPEQVANMEARAAKLGMAQTMFYMNPNNANWLKPDDAAKVEVCCNSSVLYLLMFLNTVSWACRRLELRITLSWMSTWAAAAGWSLLARGSRRFPTTQWYFLLAVVVCGAGTHPSQTSHVGCREC